MPSFLQQPRIQELTLDNYSTWVVDIRALLRTQQLWMYTQSDGADSDDPFWTEKCELAADYITLNISRDIKAHLRNEDFKDEDFNNGYTLLNRLQAVFEECGEGQTVSHMRELLTVTYNNDLDELFDHIEMVNAKMSNIIKLTSDQRSLLCLSMFLPDEYKHLIQVWTSQHPVPTMDQVCTDLREHITNIPKVPTTDQVTDLHEPITNVPSNDQGALQKKVSFVKLPASSDLCSVCKKDHPRLRCCQCPGVIRPHSVDNCWKLHPELKERYVAREGTRCSVCPSSSAFHTEERCWRLHPNAGKPSDF